VSRLRESDDLVPAIPAMVLPAVRAVSVRLKASGTRPWPYWGSAKRLGLALDASLYRPLVRDEQNQPREGDGQHDDDPGRDLQRLLVLLVEVADQAGRRVEAGIAVPCHALGRLHGGSALKPFASRPFAED